MEQSKALKDDEYILNRDWHAMTRLNERHSLFKLAQGFLLHPSINLKADAKIAEIGAGTCMWPLDLLRQLSFRVSIDAIDISMAQCPPRVWLPENITLIEHDVYQPFPSHMIGFYDVVHVQNWLCIWREHTSENLIENLVALLKPGGYLQWSEQDPTVNRIIRAPTTSSPTEATEELLAFLSKPAESISFEWVSQLGPRLAKHLALVEFDRHEIPKEHHSFWNIGVLQACEEFSSNLLRRAKTDEETSRAEKLRNATERASAELLDGVAIHTELVVAVAQKSSSAMH